MTLLDEPFEQHRTTKGANSQRWTIFSLMLNAIKEKEQRKLRFTKCFRCNRTNLYRIANLNKGVGKICCHKCGTEIPIQNNSLIPSENGNKAKTSLPLELDEKMKCNIGICGRSGDNYIISDGKMIPVCNSHYEQVKKIGMQFEKGTARPKPFFSLFM